MNNKAKEEEAKSGYRKFEGGGESFKIDGDECVSVTLL